MSILARLFGKKRSASPAPQAPLNPARHPRQFGGALYLSDGKTPPMLREGVPVMLALTPRAIDGCAQLGFGLLGSVSVILGLAASPKFLLRDPETKLHRIDPATTAAVLSLHVYRGGETAFDGGSSRHGEGIVTVTPLQGNSYELLGKPDLMLYATALARARGIDPITEFMDPTIKDSNLLAAVDHLRDEFTGTQTSGRRIVKMDERRCGKCGKAVYLAPDGYFNFKRMNEIALFCPHCDAIFCSECCHRAMMARTGTLDGPVLCAKCGERARLVGIEHHHYPSWWQFYT